MSKNSKATKKRGLKISAWIAIFSALMAGLSGVFGFVYSNYKDSHPQYEYETNQDWLHMSEAISILNNESDVKIYKNDRESEYWYEAGLVTLYHNLSKQDRVISKFRVYAENIEENYEARINYGVSEAFDRVLIKMENYGWGETGKIKICLEKGSRTGMGI